MVTWGKLSFNYLLLTRNILGEQMLGEIKLVEKDLQNFFKYVHSEHEPIKEVYHSIKDLAQLAYSRSLNKEQLYRMIS